MKKKFLLLLFIYMLPCIVFASDDFEVLSEDIKYFKTITHNVGCDLYSFNDSLSESYEIAKEEYEQQSSVSERSTTIETTYKKMTTSILSVNSYYRYKVKLEWKNIPKVRSYDTIAIGFGASVKNLGSPIFNEKYCVTNGNCYNVSGYVHSYIGRNGIGITFSVPTGKLDSLEQTMYFDVQKNTSSTIITQYAYGDYAHATKSVSLSKASDYTVTTGGINHSSDSITYYDEISTARATWSGSW